MERKILIKILTILDQKYPIHPMHTAFTHAPWQFLIAVLLSARAKDAIVIPTAQHLFSTAKDLSGLCVLSLSEIESIIRPIGTYRTKARFIQQTARILLDKYDGFVPNDQTVLESLPGVGRKTTHVIRSVLFGEPVIAVDTHVHRISNWMGIVRTQTVRETEEALMQVVPQESVSILNRIFVLHGQTVCKPRKPRCDICPVARYCAKLIPLASL